MLKLIDPNNPENCYYFDPEKLTVSDGKGSSFYLGFDISNTHNCELWFNNFEDVFLKIKEIQNEVPYLHALLIKEGVN